MPGGVKALPIQQNFRSGPKYFSYYELSAYFVYIPLSELIPASSCLEFLSLRSHETTFKKQHISRTVDELTENLMYLVIHSQSLFLHAYSFTCQLIW